MYYYFVNYKCSLETWIIYVSFIKDQAVFARVSTAQIYGNQKSKHNFWFCMKTEMDLALETKTI